MKVPIRNIKQTFLIITSPEMVKDFLSLTLKRSMCKKQVGKKKIPQIADHLQPETVKSNTVLQESTSVTLRKLTSGN